MNRSHSLLFVVACIFSELVAIPASNLDALINQEMIHQQVISVTPEMRELVCVLPEIANLARFDEKPIMVSSIYQLCSDVHKGVELIPAALVQAALKEALLCLEHIEERVIKELFRYWYRLLEAYLFQRIENRIDTLIDDIQHQQDVMSTDSLYPSFPVNDLSAEDKTTACIVMGCR